VYLCLNSRGVLIDNMGELSLFYLERPYVLMLKCIGILTRSIDIICLERYDGKF